MNAKEFQEMPLLERAEFINKLLSKYEEDSLRKAAETVNMKYSAFCKEMRRGGFTYSQSKNCYEKTLSLNDYRAIQSTVPDIDENKKALLFIANNLNELNALLNTYKTQLVLAPEVYDYKAKNVTKSLVVNKDIYEKFTDLCMVQFPHLRLRDIVSNCLNDFVKQYEKTPS